MPAPAVRVAYAADMRYVGQAYELEVPIAAPVARRPACRTSWPRSTPCTSASTATPARSSRWSSSTSARSTRYPLPRPAVTPAARATGALADAQVGERRAYFGGFVPTAIYERARLPLGARLAGPAIVEQSDTTTVIPPGVTALVDPVGNLRLRRDPVRRTPMTAIDPILLEVLRNRLDAIADEMELTLLKSAASPIVKEGLDASAALFNTRGETIAQAAAIPIHLGALQFAAQRHRARLSARAHAGGRRVPAERPLRRRHPPARHHPRGAGLRRRPRGRAGVHDVPPPGRGRPHARAACRPTPPSSTRKA